MELTAERLKSVATHASEEKCKILNHQTNIWFKDYFMDILLNKARSGQFSWDGHIVKNLAKGTAKFESYNAPETGLNFDLLKTKLENLGFHVEYSQNLFFVSWN